MSVKVYLSGILISCFTYLFTSCGDKKDSVRQTTFTKSDSLTETYLALQDSMLLMWNRMIDDDNQKLKAIRNLAHELMVSGNSDTEALVSIEQRLEQLGALRYTQETLANTEVVEEYDFATASLISEVMSIAESRSEFTYNTTLQKLANIIKMTDDRVTIYREQYDSMANQFNLFLEKNKADLKHLDPRDSIKKKPVFGMNTDAL